MLNIQILRLLIFFCLIALFPQTAFPKDAAEKTPVFRTTVLLEFIGNEDLREEAIRAFAGALDSLGDAVRVDRDANWEFRITAVHAGTSQSGQEQISVSTVLLLPFRREFLSPVISKMDPDKERELEESLSELYRYHGLWLKTLPRNELVGFAQAIAADFNRRFLVTHRRLYEKMFATRQLTGGAAEKK